MNSSRDQLEFELREARRLLLRANALWLAHLLRPDLKQAEDALAWYADVQRFVRRTTNEITRKSQKHNST